MVQIGYHITRLTGQAAADYKRITGSDPPAVVDAWIDHMMGQAYVVVRLTEGQPIQVSIYGAD